MAKKLNKKKVLDLDVENRNRDEIMKRLNEAREKCKDDDEYLRLVRDYIYEHYDPKKIKEVIGSKNIPDSLFQLLEGKGVNGLSVASLPKEYLKYQCNKYDISDILAGAENLLVSLVCEVDELVDYLLIGKIKNMEVKNEGFKSI